MPALFAFADKVIGNATISYFVAFGSFAMLLLVDFAGSIADRIRSQISLGVACAALICLGTLASSSTAAAVAGMFAIGLLVLFAGVVSSVLASATTALLLAFILPVTVPGPLSQIPDRVAGWGLAAVVSVAAISLLWPATPRNPIRASAIDACRALAARLRAQVMFVRSSATGRDLETYEAAAAEATAAVEGLQRLFYATPYRPTGLATEGRAVIRLVDELRWLEDIVLLAAPERHASEQHVPEQHVPEGHVPERHAPARSERICAVKLGAADVLEHAAALLERPASSPDDLQRARRELLGAIDALERNATSAILAPAAAGAGDTQRARRVLSAPAEIVSALDPSFRAQELSFVVGQIATNIEFAVAATRRSWLQRLVGRQPDGFSGAFVSLRERALAHASPTSSWFHNSLRGASGLALAVLVSELTSVQHGFWVVFGTLAVLRSNALATGQNLLRALLGTSAGFVVGGVLVYLIGTNTDLLWALLPIVILIAGLAPAAISFAAGQAAFTLTLLVLFNLLVPVGWKIGLVRVEDVAIGGAVSLAVGVLFWPRGARVDLRRALAGAYRESVAYLERAVAYGVGRCDRGGPHGPAPQAHAAAAAAAVRRLDDTFRGYLAERGAKPVPLAEVTSLVAGVVGIRLAADAVVELWNGDGDSRGDRAAARAELSSAAASLSNWYERFADSLTGSMPVPDPIQPDQAAAARLVDAVAHDLRDGDGHATATGVRVIWTGDHIDAVRRLQEPLAIRARETLGPLPG